MLLKIVYKFEPLIIKQTLFKQQHISMFPQFHNKFTKESYGVFALCIINSHLLFNVSKFDHFGPY